MARANLPRADAKAMLHLKQFIEGIERQPSAYMIPSPQVLTLREVIDDFAAALERATSPMTRTKVSVHAKDARRREAEQLYRLYYMLIKVNAGISAADKVAIGVKPVNAKKSAGGPPSEFPVVTITRATPGQHRVKVDRPQKAAGKPAGAVQCQLFVALGDGADQGRDAARLRVTSGRRWLDVAFYDGEAGKVATYYWRWVSAKGEAGPWSLPVSMMVVGPCRERRAA